MKLESFEMDAKDGVEDHKVKLEGVKVDRKDKVEDHKVKLEGVKVNLKDLVKCEIKQGYRKKARAMMKTKLVNRFEALAEDEDAELEIGLVDADEVQEVVEITVDSGAAKSVWPMGKKGVIRSRLRKPVKLAAANGTPIRVEGEAVLEFRRGDRKCAMKFIDADVRRPLASVAAMVDEGNTVIFGPRRSYVKSGATGEEIELVRKNGVFIMELDTGKVNKQGVKPMEVGLVEAGKKNQVEEMIFYRNAKMNIDEDFSRRV